MALAAVTLLALFIMVPQARAMIEPLVSQAEQTLDANLPIFLATFLLAICATMVSWLITHWPRREAPEPYRVIRRFRV
jgi:hypothetical protein